MLLLAALSPCVECHQSHRRHHILARTLLKQQLFLSDQLSEHLLDRSSPNLHGRRTTAVDERSAVSYLIAQGTLPWQPSSWAKFSRTQLGSRDIR